MPQVEVHPLEASANVYSKIPPEEEEEEEEGEEDEEEEAEEEEEGEEKIAENAFT